MEIKEIEADESLMEIKKARKWHELMSGKGSEEEDEVTKKRGEVMEILMRSSSAYFAFSCLKDPSCASKPCSGLMLREITGSGIFTADSENGGTESGSATSNANKKVYAFTSLEDELGGYPRTLKKYVFNITK